jgi:hypothetical protein
MTIRPLVQDHVFDVATWERDAEFGVFPQGARAKDALFAPVPAPEPVIVAGKRYLFKKSKRSYPDQFWGEVIAYRIGCLMGVRVPPAFVATNSETGQCGALIEWFYTDGVERYVHGGDFMQVVRHGFDRDKGTQHNLQDVALLMRALAQGRALHDDWRDWWARALLFDTLIGNTDRHQDNWGLLFAEPDTDEPQEIAPRRLAPLFDNGTSLGHELFPQKVQNWDEIRWQKYISKGGHHIKWDLVEDPPVKKHFDLLARVLSKWPALNAIGLMQCISFDRAALHTAIMDLAELPSPVPLSPERMKIALGLLERRHALLKELLNDHLTPPRGA